MKMITGLPRKLQTLSRKPGVYLFKNGRGEVLYVGKAKNLKNRIRSYFGKGLTLLPRTSLLRREIADLEYIIVSNEVESLILENNLIKQYRPRFNVQLRDDKNYQFLKIDYNLDIPQIYPVRKIEKTRLTKAKYFGPYTSAETVKQTLKFLKNTFHLCANKKLGAKPCFYYHLKRCPGVCIGKVSLNHYRKTFGEIEQFLNHKQKQIIKNLSREMRLAAWQKRFETAAVLRDKLQHLRRIWDKQKIVSPKNVSADYFSLFCGKDRAVVNLFLIRGGKLLHQENFGLQLPEPISEAQILESFLKQYYAESTNLPREIVLKQQLTDQKTIADWLKVKMIVPHKGKKLELLKLGEENAEAYYQRNFISDLTLLADLQKRLNLPRIPNRIEAFDISNIQGFLPVGSMVVFEEGRPQKTAYRKFKIRHQQTPDDLAMMQEMLDRRFHRLKTQSSWPEPDLIVIDGGKGQLNAALAILTKYRLAIPVIGLAKRLEEIFMPHRKESLRLSDDSPTLFLLQRIRDEAHRFAITFYRNRHQKVQTQSRLDSIPGIGPVAKKKILTKFGTVSAVKSASLEALSREVGAALAKKIREQL